MGECGRGLDRGSGLRNIHGGEWPRSFVAGLPSDNAALLCDAVT